MRFNGTMRRGLGGTAAAVAAMAALTASQAPGVTGHQKSDRHHALDQVRWTEVPNDDSYHTELPPLKTPVPPRPGVKPSPAMARSWSEAGIPATVLAAYRKAESALGRTDPGCRLPWQLLAAIGKVESGQAGGGRVDAQGTTLTPILGPVLNGAGFANIPDTDGGAYDGDATYDRAVGPMQFIPSTWAHWGRDGNGDGRRDPSNIYDAALAAGYYLCAGPRNLSLEGDLDRAILSYNHSDTYLRTVLSWLEFYRKGTHPVADGQGPVPKSPGAGGPNEATHPVGGPGSPSDDIVIGPQPTRAADLSSSGSPDPDPSPTGSASPDPSTSTDPADPGGPDPTESGSADPDPTESGSTDPDPGTTPDPSTSEPDPGTDPGCPTETPSPDPTDTAGATDSPSPDPSPGDDPCATPSEPASAG